MKMKTGFNSAEIFRKYLWYLLRERKFDTEAVNDMIQLKTSLQLSDVEVGLPLTAYINTQKFGDLFWFVC